MSFDQQMNSGHLLTDVILALRDVMLVFRETADHLPERFIAGFMRFRQGIEFVHHEIKLMTPIVALRAEVRQCLLDGVGCPFRVT